jgi:hypothetical protein
MKLHRIFIGDYFSSRHVDSRSRRENLERQIGPLARTKRARRATRELLWATTTFDGTSKVRKYESTFESTKVLSKVLPYGTVFPYLHMYESKLT